MARTDTLPHFLADVAQAIRFAETGSAIGDPIAANTFDTRISVLAKPSGLATLVGVYQFIETPNTTGLTSDWSTTVSEPITFGWTGTSTGSPGSVYENIRNSISVRYGSYGLVIYYDNEVAYTSTTYSNISYYTGWQALDSAGTAATRTIIIKDPYTISTNSAFYQWFVSNTTKVEVGGSIPTGTITINAISGYTGTQYFYYTAYENNAIVPKTYSKQPSASATLSNVVIGSVLTYDGYCSIDYGFSGGIEFVGDIRNTAYQMSKVWKMTGTTAALSPYSDCCFDGASQILMADNTTKSLVDVAIGDRVITYNETTQIEEPNEVISLGTADLGHIAAITLEDGTAIRLNPYHPMWTENGWKSLIGHKGLPILTQSDKLMNKNGEYVAIKSIENIDIETETYYTLKVANNNNFYVNGYLAQGKDKD